MQLALNAGILGGVLPAGNCETTGIKPVMPEADAAHQ